MPEIKPTQRRIALLFLLCVLSGTAGCKDRNITTYRIPKEAEDAAVPAPGADSATPATQAPARWETPAGWKSQPATGMRLASFLVSGFGGATADISIITFPGTGGDDLANINHAYHAAAPSFGKSIAVGPLPADVTWGAIQPFYISFRPELVGLGFLVTTDISLTIWLSYLVFKFGSAGK